MLRSRPGSGPKLRCAFIAEGRCGHGEQDEGDPDTQGHDDSRAADHDEKYFPQSGARRSTSSRGTLALSDQIPNSKARRAGHDSNCSRRCDIMDTARRISDMALSLAALRLPMISASSACGIRLLVTGRRGRLRPPAIIVGDQRHEGVRNLRFARQFRLGHGGHADQISAPEPVHQALRAGRERWAFHRDVAPSIVHDDRLALRLRFGRVHKQLTQHGAKRFREFHVNRRVLVKRVRPLARAVDQLLRDDEVPRLVLVAQAADGAARQDVRAAELLSARRCSTGTARGWG
jgi:hypothetical protein